MIGANKADLYEEGFSEDDLRNMVGWGAACDGLAPEKYIRSGKIITSVAFGFRQWARVIGQELGLKTMDRSFDL